MLDDDTLLFHSSPARAAGYSIAGAVLTLASDTLYSNGGYSGSFFPPLLAHRYPTTVRMGRIFSGLLGTILLWVGLCDVITSYLGMDSNVEWQLAPFPEHTVPASGSGSGYAPAHRLAWGKYLLKDSLCVVLGFVILFVTNTFWTMACLHPECPSSSDEPEAPLDHTSSWQSHARQSAMCLVSVFGQCSLWMGVWNLLEYYFESTIWREVAYLLFGLLIFFATGTFLTRTYVADDEVTEIRQPWSICLMLRATISILGHLIHQTGVWTILDVFLWEDTHTRDAVYVVVGVTMLFLSGTLETEACVSPISILPRAPEQERTMVAATLYEELYSTSAWRRVAAGTEGNTNLRMHSHIDTSRTVRFAHAKTVL